MTRINSNFSSKKYTKKCSYFKKVSLCSPNTPLASLISLKVSAYKSTTIPCQSVPAWWAKLLVWEKIVLISRGSNLEAMLFWVTKEILWRSKPTRYSTPLFHSIRRNFRPCLILRKKSGNQLFIPEVPVSPPLSINSARWPARWNQGRTTKWNSMRLKIWGKWEARWTCQKYRTSSRKNNK